MAGAGPSCYFDGMSAPSLLALLGPTNTGKTHLAIETMVEHDDGVIGLPLRLLAREVYDRLCLKVGRERCALVTGEEKIIPEGARYFACTVEAMPQHLELRGSTRPFSFVAVDEIQLCADRERGHIFTDRLLHRRGTRTTMVMGADTMAEPLRRLFGDAVVIERRPRLSQLSHVGSKKISRLPPRSAVVAFSIADVYALAEDVRHHHGGAAVVTGALSPSTRNAQVAMFQRGEVDVLVATDAIGMGLNLDITHVAFAELHKFDGDDVRPLSVAELAQIAGRAGRHTTDGTFGVSNGLPLLPRSAIDALEHHAFPPVTALCWRNSDLDTDSLHDLLHSLKEPPATKHFGFLVSGRPSSDLLALERLVHHPHISASVGDHDDDVLAFFEHCQIPDFARIAPDDHAALILAVWSMTQSGGVTADWLNERVSHLDRDDGDVDTLVARLARVRTLTYITHKSGWVRDANHWQHVTRRVEDRLSDALHERLTHRFVDKLRTVVMGGRVKADVDDSGGVSVAGESIGRLQGLRFVADSDDGRDRARLRVTAAARGLTTWMKERVEALLAAEHSAFGVDVPTLTVTFDGQPVGRLVKGRSRLWPRALPLTDDTALDTGAYRARLEDKLTAAVRQWVEGSLPLVCAIDPDSMAQSARSIARAVQDGLGLCDRHAIEAEAGAVDDDGRKSLRKARVRLGFLDVFVDDAFKERAVKARAALLAVWQGHSSTPPLPPSGVSSFLVGERPVGFVRALGFHVADGPELPKGPRAFRADLVDDVGVLLKTLPLPSSVPASALERLGCGREEFLPVLSWLGYGLDSEGRVVRSTRRRARAGATTTTPPRSRATTKQRPTTTRDTT